MFYVCAPADQLNSTCATRATESGYSAVAAAYSPRVWDEAAKAWVLHQMLR